MATDLECGAWPPLSRLRPRPLRAPRRSPPKRRPGAARHGILFALLITAGCRQDMQDQPKYLPLQPSKFFADGRSSRPLVAGTIARGHLQEDAVFYTGKNGTDFVSVPPMPVSATLLGRGRERYDIYCSPCHDRVGNGEGMIVQRGYRRPPSFHIDRLRAAPAGYFFDAITNGFGVMPKYRIQIPAADRWAIVAYIRALQLSQHATIGDVPAAERDRLLTPVANAADAEAHHE